MGFLFSSFFWGAVIILFGLSIILKAIFNIKIPVFSIIIALIFIWLGLKILFGAFGVKTSKNTVVFSEGSLKVSEKNEDYNIVMGRGTIDLTEMGITEDSPNVEINIVFGKAEVKIDSNKPMIMKVSSVFAGAHLPGGNVAAIGNNTYATPSYEKSKPHLVVKADVVFGELNIIDISQKEKKEKAF